MSGQRGVAFGGPDRHFALKRDFLQGCTGHFHLCLRRRPRSFGLARVQRDQRLVGELCSEIRFRCSLGILRLGALIAHRERYLIARHARAVDLLRRLCSTVDGDETIVMRRRGARGIHRQGRRRSRGFRRLQGFDRVAPLPLESANGAQLLARRTERLPTSGLVEGRHGSAGRPIKRRVDRTRMEPQPPQCSLELAYIVSVCPGNEIAVGGYLALKHEHRAARCRQNVVAFFEPRLRRRQAADDSAPGLQSGGRKRDGLR